MQWKIIPGSSLWLQTQCILHKNLIYNVEEMGSFGSKQDPQLSFPWRKTVPQDLMLLTYYSTIPHTMHEPRKACHVAQQLLGLGDDRFIHECAAVLFFKTKFCDNAVVVPLVLLITHNGTGHLLSLDTQTNFPIKVVWLSDSPYIVPSIEILEPFG